MATKTLGTAGTATLTALQFQHGFASGMAVADVATISQAILNDISNSHPNVCEAFSSNGLLYIPNRGVLKMRAGDYVAVDPATGWPTLWSALAAAGASVVHT